MDKSIRLLRRFTRSLGHVRGAGRLIHFIRQTYCRRLGSVTLNDFDGDQRISVELSDHVGSRIFWTGHYSLGIIRAMDQHLRPGDVFCDVGANIGEITLAAAKRVGSSGRVLAFEPVSDINRKLRENVALNDHTNIEVFSIGLADRTAEVPIYTEEVFDSAGTKFQGVGSLYDQHSGSSSSESISESIQVTTLDALVQERQINRVDFIKIDVEGADLDVLRGAEQTIRRNHPRLILEVSRESCQQANIQSEDLLTFLAQFGYVFQDIDYQGRLTRIDADSLGDFHNVLCTAVDAEKKVA